MQLCSTLYLIQRNVQNTCRFRQDICTTDLLLQSPTLREQTLLIHLKVIFNKFSNLSAKLAACKRFSQIFLNTVNLLCP